MKFTGILLICLISLIPTAHACDEDYSKRAYDTLRLVESTAEQDNKLGAARRDCLAVELQSDESMCQSFRRFEKEFLVLSQDEQRNAGPRCFKNLADTKAS